MSVNPVKRLTLFGTNVIGVLARVPSVIVRVSSNCITYAKLINCVRAAKRPHKTTMSTRRSTVSQTGPNEVLKTTIINPPRRNGDSIQYGELLQSLSCGYYGCRIPQTVVRNVVVHRIFDKIKWAENV